MKVFIEKENKHLELNKSCKVKTLLDELNINYNEVLVIKNDEVVLLEEELNKEDSIKVLSVVSGG